MSNTPKKIKCKKMGEKIEKALLSDDYVSLPGKNDGQFWVVNLTRWEMRLQKRKIGCWDWKGSYHRQGYGMYRAKKIGYNTKFATMNAQRVAMALKLGRALENEERVSCTCGKLDCCNPDHLEIIDYKMQAECLIKYDRDFIKQNAKVLVKTVSTISRELGVSLGVALAMKFALVRYLEQHL